MLQVPLWFKISVVRAWNRLSQLGLILSLAFFWGLCWSPSYSRDIFILTTNRKLDNHFVSIFVMKFREASFSKKKPNKKPLKRNLHSQPPKQINIKTHAKNTSGKKGQGLWRNDGNCTTVHLLLSWSLDAFFSDLPIVTGFWMTVMKFNQDYLL